MRNLTRLWLSLGVALLVAAGVPLDSAMGGQAATHEQAQAAIGKAEALLNDLQSGLTAASEEVQDDLVGQLQEAALDLYKARLRLEANDPQGALDDAEEALEELAKAQKRLDQSIQ